MNRDQHNNKPYKSVKKENGKYNEEFLKNTDVLSNNPHLQETVTMIESERQWIKPDACEIRFISREYVRKKKKLKNCYLFYEKEDILETFV